MIKLFPSDLTASQNKSQEYLNPKNTYRKTIMSSAQKHKIENVWYPIKYCQREKKEESIIHNGKKNLSTIARNATGDRISKDIKIL